MTTISRTGGFDAIRREDEAGEFWSARDLQPRLGYVEWRKFEDAIKRAKIAAANSGVMSGDHFGGAAKMVDLGSSATREIADYRLTRYAAYLVAMNGDPRKREIADAQTYFAVKTREAEARPAQVDISAITRSDLARMVLESETAREAAEAERDALKPSADAWDHLASTAHGDFSLNEAAKTLCRDDKVVVGERRLFTLLESWGWIYRDPAGDWRPYQAQVDSGRLATRARSHHHPRTGELVMDAPQVRVTAKGVEAIYRRLSAVVV